MASPVKITGKTLCYNPFLMRKFVFKTGKRATPFEHGGPNWEPDFYWTVNLTANPSEAGVSIYNITKTHFTLDCQDDGNDTVEVFLAWFSAASGGIGED